MDSFNIRTSHCWVCYYHTATFLGNPCYMKTFTGSRLASRYAYAAAIAKALKKRGNGSFNAKTSTGVFLREWLAAALPGTNRRQSSIQWTFNFSCRVHYAKKIPHKYLSCMCNCLFRKIYYHKNFYVYSILPFRHREILHTLYTLCLSHMSCVKWHCLLRCTTISARFTPEKHISGGRSNLMPR